MDCLPEIQKEMQEMRKRLDHYERKYKEDCQSKNTVDDLLKAQKLELDEMNMKLDRLNELVLTTAQKVHNMELKLDSLEQYSRSNCLLLHTKSSIQQPTADDNLFYEKISSNIINEHLNLNQPITEKDIDVAHTLPSKKGNLLIIKFVRRSLRNEIYYKKKYFKGTGHLLTESLTNRRLKLLRLAKNTFEPHRVWTNQGNIYVFHNNKKHLITKPTDVDKLINNY